MREPLKITGCGRLRLMRLLYDQIEIRTKCKEVGGEYLLDSVSDRMKRYQKAAPQRNHVVTDYEYYGLDMVSETIPGRVFMLVELSANGFHTRFGLDFEFEAGALEHEEIHDAIRRCSEDMARYITQHKIKSGTVCGWCGNGRN